MFASLVTRTPRQAELTAISRSTPDTTVTATPTVTDREHDGWGGGGWWVGIRAGVYTSGTNLTRECKFVKGMIYIYTAQRRTDRSTHYYSVVRPDWSRCAVSQLGQIIAHMPLFVCVNACICVCVYVRKCACILHTHATRMHSCTHHKSTTAQ